MRDITPIGDNGFVYDSPALRGLEPAPIEVRPLPLDRIKQHLLSSVEGDFYEFLEDFSDVDAARAAVAEFAAEHTALDYGVDVEALTPVLNAVIDWHVENGHLL